METRRKRVLVADNQNDDGDEEDGREGPRRVLIAYGQ